MRAQVAQQADFFQQTQRQGVGFVDQQQHAALAAVGGRQVFDDRQTKLPFVHVAIGPSECVQDRLKQGAAGAQPAAGQHRHLEGPPKLLRQQQTKQRLAGARRRDNEPRPFASLNAAGERCPCPFNRVGGEVLVHLRHRRERSPSQAETAVVHRLFFL